MSILELRILPPLAVGRLGSADRPLEAFDLEVNPEKPLDYRKIVPRDTLVVDPQSGRIVETYVPQEIRFKDERRRIHPVAPFLEVFARTSAAPDALVPLTLDLLAKEGLTLQALDWHVEVANLKVFRRTGDPKDRMEAEVNIGHQHTPVPLEARCGNFRDGKTLPLGQVQFIQPDARHPEIRLRFTPAHGKVYGSALWRIPAEGMPPEKDPVMTPELVLYDPDKGTWRGYVEGSGTTLTNPAQIFAGYNRADGTRVSWGYLDDECDGIVRVRLKLHDGQELVAQSHICAGPPAFAPDTLPIRVITDELEQILYGPAVRHEDTVPIEEAEEIVRRSLETIRLLNSQVMNGNPVNGRPRVASTMAQQDSNDFERYYEPIAATSLVDNFALRQLHERVFSALSSGTAPWFSEALRRPEDIGDLSSQARRKMPAMMRGADGRALTLTRRQIDIVTRAAAHAMFGSAPRDVKEGTESK